MNSFKSCFLLILLFSATTFVAQDRLAPSPIGTIAEEPLSFFEYIIRDSISKMTMMADFSTLRKNKYVEEYYDGHLSFLNGDSLLQSFSASFRSRGNSRKKLCFHPSLKIKLPKKKLKKYGLNKDNKYKLVCQCSYGKVHQQSLLREYLAYKIFNLISPYSFRVHLLEIDYIELPKARKTKRVGFLLESKKSLEKRLDGIILEREEIELDKISRTESIRMSLFQYMIANTDWNIPALHNVKLLLSQDKDLVPIPYDYDYSGIADTPYATANPDYPIKKHTDRYFLSNEYTEEEINEQLVYFLEQKEEVIALINQSDFLSRSSRRFVNRFINEFYKTIENEKKRRRKLVKIKTKSSRSY